MNLTQHLVDMENELYKVQQDMNALQKREAHLICEIQSIEDVIGVNSNFQGRPIIPRDVSKM